MKKLVAIAAFLFTTSATATTGNQLMADCTTPGRDTWCMKYIDGVTDGAIQFWIDSLLTTTFALIRRYPYSDKDNYVLERPFCIPEGVTLGQLRNIVLAYLRDNPAETHKPASGLVLLAITKAFPCPKRAPSQ